MHLPNSKTCHLESLMIFPPSLQSVDSFATLSIQPDAGLLDELELKIDIDIVPLTCVPLKLTYRIYTYSLYTYQCYSMLPRK